MTRRLRQTRTRVSRPVAFAFAIPIIAGGDLAFGQVRTRSAIPGPMTREAIVRSLTVAPVEVDANERIEVSLLLRIAFPFDSAVLTRPAMRDLDRVAAALADARLAIAPVIVEDHSDALGDAAYNRRLSQRRAEAVVAHLVRLGIPGARLRAVGYGADRPLTSYPPRDGRQRRVEIVRMF